jgi:LuxR family maltose regulon positive regulatory protein
MASTGEAPEPTGALLRTKLLIPTPREDLVRRQRLIDLLGSNLYEGGVFPRKLTLIAAPAGYGKTTLASQWLAEAGISAAWLTLEASENDPTRFFTYTVAAFQMVVPGIGRPVLRMLAAPQRPPQEVMLTALINELAKHESPLIFALDDYHLIQSQSVHAALKFLVEHLPPNVHLAIMSREDPPLPLHRLQARRQMVGIRQADLSFGVEEAKALFRLLLNSELMPDQAARLTRRTEGWVTGLQLAALSMRHAPDPQKFIDSFTGSNRYILDYLFEEVFEGQAEDVRSFLLQTAILNRFCGPLADAVTGGEGGSAIIRQLERANFFVVPLDQSREWYRYHRLFSDLLRNRLARSSIEPDVLHARASQWYVEHGDVDEATEHALAGRHWERAGKLIDKAGDAKLRSGEIATLLGWCKRMPEETLLSRVNWALTYAWALILSGDLESGWRVLQEIRAENKQLPDHVLGQLAAAEAFASRSRGDHIRTIDLSKEAISLLPAEDRNSRGSVSLNLGLICWHLGRLEEAEAALREALIDTQATGNQFAHHTAQVFMARLLASRGDLSAAVNRLERTMGGADQLPTAALAHADLAAINYEWDELSSAWRHLERATSIAEATGNVEFQVACWVQRALFHLMAGEAGAARAALDPAITAERDGRLPPLTGARVSACRVQLALQEGRIGRARELHAGIPMPHDAQTFTRFIDLNGARILLAEGDQAAARDELQRAHEQAVASGWTYALCVVRVLQSLAEDDPLRAADRLATAIREAQPLGFRRVFLNEGRGVLKTLTEVARRGVFPSYVGALLSAGEAHPASLPGMAQLVEPLTDREMEVLRLLGAGLSNRQIAEQLVVSLGTAKSHIHHIFGKLEVSSRAQASARARKLGLI